MMRRLVLIFVTAGIAISAAWLTSRPARTVVTPQVANASLSDESLEEVSSDAGKAIVQSPVERLRSRREYYRQLTKQSKDWMEDQWLHHFQLTERSGETVTDQDLAGKPYVVSFFFTRCPTICVQQNDRKKLLQAKFRDAPVRFVSITCDPEFDSPEILRAYAERLGVHGDQWIFLTGEWDYLRRVSGEVFFNGLHSPRFHIEKFLLVSADGHVLCDYDWHDAEELKILEADINALLELANENHEE